MERRSHTYSPVKRSMDLEWTLACADRRSLRRMVAEKWLEEDPYTNYRYNVEQCESG